jgi:hypothetical protein
MKDFEWLTKAKENGFEFTKKEYTYEEYERMGIPLDVQRENARKLGNHLATMNILTLTGSLIFFGLIPIIQKFFVVSLCLFAFVLIALPKTIELVETRQKIEKLMYLRSLRKQ